MTVRVEENKRAVNGFQAKGVGYTDGKWSGKTGRYAVSDDFFCFFLFSFTP